MAATGSASSELPHGSTTTERNNPMSAMMSLHHTAEAQDEACRIFALQRAAVQQQGAPTYQERMAALEALFGSVKQHRHELAASICADFGNRSSAETDFGEIMPVLNSIKHARKHLKGWMKPVRRSVGMAFRPASARIVYQPLGVVGVLAPWNYPLTLTLVPLVEALAAGNRVMIKPSELTPSTSKLLAALLSKIFPEDRVAVILGGSDVAGRFSTLPFDHLFFTGSTSVGRSVMTAASANLTPVTLELGGKSPVVVCRDYPLKKAARLIAIGKLFNGGQSCVAPDYVLAPEDQVDAFAKAFLEAAAEMYPRVAGNADYTSVISDRHHRRLVDMIEDARSAGARVLQHDDTRAAGERKVPPTVLLGVPTNAMAMREEIFGPILPVIGYRDIQQAIELINARPKPLALYCFSNDHRAIDAVLDNTRSGGVTVNGTLLHATQEDLPFGGVGESGTGAYHGRDGFIRLSHARGVMTLSPFNKSDLVAAPYGKLSRFVARLFLGN
ncbi:coniferyl aldehyde dehydrogenase [Variovorax sp. AFSI2.2]|uniref:coniferyl aldehyde dehydrogenase n=1 Tax=Variovorax sp. AFSI2.2 TaxID=3384160 RepID=UPI003EBA5D42